MVDCLSAEAAQWDALMNRWYGEAMKQAQAADADLKEAESAASPAAPLLKSSQRDWITFRDASLRLPGRPLSGRHCRRPGCGGLPDGADRHSGPAPA